MDCFCRSNKIGAEINHRSRRCCTPRRPRVNGWSWPPHPYQILSRIAYVYFLIVVIGIFIPLLPSRWAPAGYISLGVAFSWHLAFQVIAATVDPAEDSVRAKGYKRLPPVYRGKPLNASLRKRYCPLCEVEVCQNSKHCNRCKKCVGNFDHHCKWLNNCVGGRNYRYFLGCVLSAVLCCLIIITISGFVFIGIFINPKLLRSSPEFGLINDTNTWLVYLPYFSVRTNLTTIVVLAAVTIGLSLTALIVLCDLLFFHFYLMWKRMSTYEYILFHCERQESKVSPKDDADIEALRFKSNQNAENVATHQNVNTEVHFESTSTNGSVTMSTVCSVLAAGPPAEYHSDSAESINEIPMDQTRLGSAAVAMQTSTALHSTEDSFANSLQSAISKVHQNKTPSQPATSKTSKVLDPNFKQFYGDPPVNDRHRGDEMPHPE